MRVSTLTCDQRLGEGVGGEGGVGGLRVGGGYRRLRSGGSWEGGLGDGGLVAVLPYLLKYLDEGSNVQR